MHLFRVPEPKKVTWPLEQKPNKQNVTVHTQGVAYAIKGIYLKVFNHNKPLVQMSIRNH